jgi:glyoxylase-like metal-dependent hydrolase (beta-lactamase superfamily II)
MKIIPLKKDTTIYSCNSYLILGDWNHIDDVNTIIDPGVDDFVINEIEHLATGLGKVPVAQVLLTHNHFDHARSVQAIKERFNARVLAFSEGPGVDELVKDGQLVKAGDQMLEVLHTPGHSSDSICLYAPAEKALFSGDTRLRVMPGESFHQEYVDGLMKIACRETLRIFPGHESPITSGCQEMILNTVRTFHLRSIPSRDRRPDLANRISVQV